MVLSGLISAGMRVTRRRMDVSDGVLAATSFR
jgi:hypothetical protein